MDTKIYPSEARIEKGYQLPNTSLRKNRWSNKIKNGIYPRSDGLWLIGWRQTQLVMARHLNIWGVWTLNTPCTLVSKSSSISYLCIVRLYVSPMAITSNISGRWKQGKWWWDLARVVSYLRMTASITYYLSTITTLVSHCGTAPHYQYHPSIQRRWCTTANISHGHPSAEIGVETQSFELKIHTKRKARRVGI